MKFNLLFYILLASIVSVIFQIDVTAQLGRNCQVVAKISPSTLDSTVPEGTTVVFSSLSENATSYQWLTQGFNFSYPNAPYSYSTRVGFQTISLVATNGVCSDTTSVLYFSPGTPHEEGKAKFQSFGYSRTFEYAQDIAGTYDSGFILVGEREFFFPCGTEGLVVKLNKKGCIDWSKRLIDTQDVYCKFATTKKIAVNPDGSSFIGVQKGSGFMKIDQGGNRVWSNTYRINHPVYYPLANENELMCVDGIGNLYLASMTVDFGLTISKINKDGDVQWVRFLRLVPYNPSNPLGEGYVIPRSLVWLNDKIYVAGERFLNNSSTDNFLLRLNAFTGQAEWQYAYETEGKSFDNISIIGPNLLIGLGGSGMGACIVDPNGTVIKYIKLSSVDYNFSPQLTRVIADKKGYLYFMQWVKETLSLQPYFSYTTIFAKIDSSLNKYWSFAHRGVAQYGHFVASSLNSADVFGAVALDNSFVGEPISYTNDINFLKIDSTFDSQANFECGIGTDIVVTTGVHNKNNFSWLIDSTLTVIKNPITYLEMQDAFIQSQLNCPSFVDSCSYIKITGQSEFCSPNYTYTFRSLKNRKCGLVPKWTIPAGAMISNQTDTTITIKFPDFGRYTITVQLDGCIPVKDSMTINIRSKQLLNLGQDTSNCNQSPITLRAGPSFMSYRWNTGSTDSLITVSLPGTYSVEVTDSCGNLLKDTINVSIFNYPISLGPDRNKCNLDTVQIAAPPGFISYLWLTNYNISSTTSQDVVVNPITDTSYILRAEKLPGCYSFDTVHVKVNRSPNINLGKDTSICEGKTISFDAGTGFSSYLWNVGSVQQQITTNSKGIFSVIGTTPEGCKSFDTVQLVNVWALPKVTITGDSVICEGGFKTIDAGAFTGSSTYRWNDGSNGRTLAIYAPGVYAVSVTDDKGCIGVDSFLAKGLVPNPKTFLPPDTLLCTYAKLDISPTSTFTSYLWNTQQSSRSITITQPGLYWLQVTDANKCIGKDSIAIGKKDCLEGVFVPNAFTPNADGKNDLFKALIFGNVKYFELFVYNRWGQIIFQTKDPLKGWDGTVAGQMQNSGVFTWTIKYQLDGQPAKAERGTISLIR